MGYQIGYLIQRATKKKVAEAERFVQNGELIKIDAWLRYYYHEKTELLDEETYWIRWSQLKFCLKALGKLKE